MSALSAENTLRRIWQAGVDAVRGDTAVAAALASDAPPRPDRILAVGKAAVPMARAALARYAAVPALAVTKYGHGTGAPPGLTVLEAAHPVPDAASLAAGRALYDAVAAMSADETLLLLVSGGASALAECPAEGVSLDDLAAENARLLAGGQDIHAINARRRALSRIKGGGLLAAFGGAGATVLAISDVSGDDIAVIGSGIGQCPAAAGGTCETRIVASNAIARDAAAAAARAAGLAVHVNAEDLYGEVELLARALGPRLRALPPGVAILGGEPTVTLPPDPGRGGRNQALALALARQIAGEAGLTLLVAGTDGTDGPTQAAGGIVDGASWARATGGAEALARADAGRWLAAQRCLFTTGPTGTNVMDLMIALRG
ncbi:DUF4147 domain-containing protein [Rhodovulum sp. YNF3179]|uniref:DUF4147 domain-containing protein n=1 Tax=Rhodovulum sp. YNF3179 TaxID=3425127 RepID=UPI003D349648